MKTPHYVDNRPSPAMPRRSSEGARGSVLRVIFTLVPALLLVLTGLGAALLGADAALAQSSFPAGGSLAGSVFADKPQLFPEDDRIKVLAVALSPFGLTETAAEQIGLILQKDLANSGQFAVVGPREANAVFEKERPELVDCREIACGVESGKRLGAERVLVGTIRLKGQIFILTVRLIDTLNNITDYEEEIQFSDESMDEELFRLSNNISRNSLYTGRVLSTSIRGIVISLGKQHGLKIGDELVVYKQEVPITSLQGEQLDIQKKNIAIVKVLNVNDKTSEAIISHSTEQPQVAHYAQTYLDTSRQIELVANTRKELDTGIRLENKIRPLTLAPVLLADSERRKWQLRLNKAEQNHRFWTFGGIIAGGATLFFLQDYSDSDLNLLRTIAAGVATGFAVKRYIETRDEIDEVKIEGRSKGYLTSDISLGLAPGYVGLALRLRY
ncbi:MAG: hypothetical protein O7E56_09195 [SAR324 cluster bacterium]|nr:hypothetical protein [SAR324 cluster bacterium]